MSDPTPTPSADIIEWAAEMLGCIPMTDRVAAKWCGIHGHWDTAMDGLPCPVAVDLAAKIAARDARRDAQTRADECEAIAAITAAIRNESMSHPSERGDEEWNEGIHDTLEAFASQMRERAAAHRERVQG